MNGIQDQKNFWVENGLYRIKETVRGKGDPPVESLGSDWTPCSVNSSLESSLGATGP